MNSKITKKLLFTPEEMLALERAVDHLDIHQLIGLHSAFINHLGGFIYTHCGGTDKQLSDELLDAYVSYWKRVVCIRPIYK